MDRGDVSIGRPAVEVEVDVDPIGNLTVFGRETQTAETDTHIIEQTRVGYFRETSPFITPEPVQVIGPGVMIEDTTDLG